MPVTVRVPPGLVRQPPEHVATYLALMLHADRGEDSPTLAQLADTLDVASASSIVRRLSAMEQRGMIVRHPWPSGVKRTRYELRLGH